MWPPAQITREILERADRFGSRNPQELKLLRKALGSSDPQTLFDALFAAIVDESDPLKAAERQQLAGRLLLMLEPPCPHPAKNVIRLLITTWDVSVEEIPWYLSNVLGKDMVLDAVSELLREPLNDVERKKVETVRYWVTPYNGEVRRYY